MVVEVAVAVLVAEVAPAAAISQLCLMALVINARSVNRQLDHKRTRCNAEMAQRVLSLNLTFKIKELVRAFYSAKNKYNGIRGCNTK